MTIDFSWERDGFHIRVNEQTSFGEQEYDFVLYNGNGFSWKVDLLTSLLSGLGLPNNPVKGFSNKLKEYIVILNEYPNLYAADDEVGLAIKVSYELGVYEYICTFSHSPRVVYCRGNNLCNSISIKLIESELMPFNKLIKVLKKRLKEIKTSISKENLEAATYKVITLDGERFMKQSIKRFKKQVELIDPELVPEVSYIPAEDSYVAYYVFHDEDLWFIRGYIHSRNNSPDSFYNSFIVHLNRCIKFLRRGGYKC